ncbi:MAG: hypothetical protein KGL26_00510, partial [Pseudomonadota bacterium]|nr:hypothetical protein [Pseudomonadota bacterium]
MNEKLAGLIDQIEKLHAELDREVVRRREELGVRISGRIVEFEKEVAEQHRRLRTSLLKYIAGADLLTVLTAPVIYAMVAPIALLDLWVTVYQHICFRAYGIARVRRGDYVVVDRQHLAYLNGIEVFNCLYCGYANGVIAYAREIAGRTELYWCPIKHARRAKRATRALSGIP